MEKHCCSPEYLHFNKLIWQVAGMCTLLFIITFPILDMMTKSLFFMDATGFSRNIICITFLIIVFVFLFIFAGLLYRFRVNQAFAGVQSKISKDFKSCGFQFLLQFIVNFQVSAIFFLILLCHFKLNIHIWHIFFPALGLLVVMTLFTELCVFSTWKKDVEKTIIYDKNQ